jgi:hypothetical protein
MLYRGTVVKGLIIMVTVINKAPHAVVVAGKYLFPGERREVSEGAYQAAKKIHGAKLVAAGEKPAPTPPPPVVEAEVVSEAQRAAMQGHVFYLSGRWSVSHSELAEAIEAGGGEVGSVLADADYVVAKPDSAQAAEAEAEGIPVISAEDLIQPQEVNKV